MARDQLADDEPDRSADEADDGGIDEQRDERRRRREALLTLLEGELAPLGGGREQGADGEHPADEGAQDAEHC